MRKIALGIAAMASFSGTAHALPFINGSFESGPANPGNFATLPGDSTAIDGWVVEGDSVDFIGDYWKHHDGNRSIDLAGSGIGGIAQTFDTLAGQLYRVTFYIARNPDNGQNPRTGFASILGGPNTPLSFNNTSTTRDAMGWQKRTFTFTGTGSNTLRFGSDGSSLGNGSGPFFGLALDNVSFAAVPEPSTWAMLILGFGFVGSAMRRRKTNVRVAYA